jgi:hypothetical protein
VPGTSCATLWKPVATSVRSVGAFVLRIDTLNRKRLENQWEKV